MRTRGTTGVSFGTRLVTKKECKNPKRNYPTVMLRPVDTRIPGAVQDRVQAIYRSLFPRADDAFVPQAFQWAGQCFAGRYADYQAIDAGYHDLEHTLQGTLCLALLLQGRHAARAQPTLSARMFELSLLAILFHDTGYLKKRGDGEGTGAKYTLEHVGRSVVFAGQFLEQGDGQTARRHLERLAQLTEALVQTDALAAADGQGVIRSARRLAAGDAV